MSLVCSTCLSRARPVRPLPTDQLRSVFYCVLRRPYTSEVSLCWECEGFLINCLKFKRKAYVAKSKLQQVVDQKKCQASTLSSLAIQIKQGVDYIYKYEPRYCAFKVPNTVKCEPDQSIHTATLSTNTDPLKEYAEHITEDSKHFIEITENVLEDPEKVVQDTKNFAIDSEKSLEEKTENMEVENEYENVIVKSEKVLDFTAFDVLGDASEKIKVENIDTSHNEIAQSTHNEIAQSSTQNAQSGFKTKIIEKNMMEENPSTKDSMIKQKKGKVKSRQTNTVNDILHTKVVLDKDGEMYIELDAQKPVTNMASAITTVFISRENMLQLRKHEVRAAEHTSATHKCDFCILQFHSFHELLQHNESFHVPKPGDSLCTICSSWLPVADLASHCQRHCFLFECRLCNYTHHKEKNVEEHVASKHTSVTKQGRKEINVDTDKEIACEVCGEKYMGEFNLQKHMKTAHKKKKEDTSHRCEPCDKVFQSFLCYKAHLNTLKHVDELRFSCEECNKRFPSKMSLGGHRKRWHVDSKVCPVCDKTFSNSCSMKIHMKSVHEGVKKQKEVCSVCGDMVRNMRTHMQTHSSERKYVCNICGATFKQNPALYMHNKLVHLKAKRPKKRPKQKEGKESTSE